MRHAIERTKPEQPPGPDSTIGQRIYWLQWLLSPYDDRPLARSPTVRLLGLVESTTKRWHDQPTISAAQAIKMARAIERRGYTADVRWFISGEGKAPFKGSQEPYVALSVANRPVYPRQRKTDQALQWWSQAMIERLHYMLTHPR